MSLLALAVGIGLLTVAAAPVAGQTLPTGGRVAAGSVTIGQPVGGQMTVRQTTDRGVVNWQTFNVGAGGRVDFQQPSASSATLNRVTGSTGSVIAGQLSANGQVFLVNPNGIQITPSGVVRGGAFVASTLDIKNSDFLAGRTVFEGKGRSGSVVNQGTIEAAPGGSVVLMGGRVVNEGTITANGGRVGLAAGERVVVDLQGDGFLQVSVPTADADRSEALIKHTGRIQANGGPVAMRAATTADVARAAVTVSGTVEARTVMRTDGGVVFGADTVAPPTKTPVTVQRGKVDIDGGPGGSVKTSGRIAASGGTQRGGDIGISGNAVTTTGTLDVSGGTVGGTITVNGGTRLDASGTFLASGVTTGGRIDLTADDVRVTQASLLATGGHVGGLIRIGGAFQGGAPHDLSPALRATYVTRWADAPALHSATQTRVANSVTIDVSGGNTGGTAIVWANGTTWMNGVVRATGASSAGSVEISGKENLAFVDLAKLEIGAGGQLLLDPKNIVIDNGGSASVSGNDAFGENSSGVAFIAPSSLTAILDKGTSVTLQANNDIFVNNGWSASGPGSNNGGNITLEAGRSIIIAAGSVITTDNGSITLIANTSNSSRITGQRDAGAATIDMRGATILAGTGAVTITMGNGSTGGDIRLGTITTVNSGSVQNIAVAMASAGGSVELNGNLTSGDNIALPDRNIIVGANSVLTSGTGDSISWLGEASGKTITGVLGGETIRFVEGSTVTRIGVMDKADAARLSFGPGGSQSRPYGDPNPSFDAPVLTAGSLRAGDTLATLLVSGSVQVDYPSGAPTATTSAGTSRSFSISDTASTAFAGGKSGYFLNTSTVSGTLTIARRPITVTADAKTKTYGNADPALTYQITSGNLVNGDALSGSLSRVSGTNVGTYAINQNNLTNSNYNITYVGANLTIGARPITVTADANSKIYGNVDPTLTYQITAGNLVGADALGGSLGRAPGENVGPYAINQGSLANSNYAITFAGANLTINRRPITVTAQAKTKVYGDADPALTYSVGGSGLAFADTLSGSLARNLGQNVGTYAILQGSLAASSNYTLTYVGANLTIGARPITVTADAKSKTYGNADPALTYQVTSGNLVGGDTLSGGLARNPGENVGAYAILQGSLANSNYAITYVGANLTIGARPITVTADAGTKIYGNVDPTRTYQVTSGSLVGGDTLSGALTRTAGENVGTYAILQGSLGNSNYAITYVGANFAITARPITITADAKTKTYGDADPALTYRITSGGLAFSDTLSGALTRNAGENVGAYAILQGSLAASSNYAVTYVGANLTIGARPITVTADAKSKVYGDADPALTYRITSGSLVGGDTLNGALSRVSGNAVGTYAINQNTLTNTNNPNYAITYVGANIIITARPITVTADGGTKIYGNVDPTLTYLVTSGSLIGGDTLSGALTRNAGENVGTYAIVQGSLGNPNYAITYVGANFTITTRPITITADARTKTYGDADPALTYRITSGSLAFADTLSGALARNAGETVGAYAILQGSLTASSNYAVTYVGANLTIGQRPITVTADARSKIYGDADPALTYQVTSGTLVGGDTLSGALTRNAGETVGAYAILQGSLGNSNYAITYVGASLAIGARPITVTADSKTKTYGDADPALTYQITTGNLVGGDTLSGALTRNAGENAGAYAILQGSLGNSNYAITYVGANLTIGARPITVTADARTKIYGDADPALTYQVTSGNLVGGDTLSGGLTRNAGENVGAYAILQGSLANSNYAITYVGANLTISARPITVTADGKTKTYGDADPVLTYQVTSGNLVGSDTLSGGLMRNAGENVGAYAILQGSLGNSNYAITYVDANLTIGTRPITVTADGKTKTYGDADPALTYQVTSGNLVGSDTLSGGLTRNTGENVGAYTILQGTLANSNYAISYVGSDLTIAQRPITVTADAKTKTYGDADSALTYSVTSGNLAFADTLSGGLSRQPGENAGIYGIVQGSLNNANYVITYVGANLTITPAVLNVVADARTKVYGDADPVLTFAVNGFRFADSAATVLGGGLSRSPGESVLGGPYAIGQGSLAANGNYTLAYTPAALTITPRPLTVTADSHTKIALSPDPTFTWRVTAGNVVFGDTPTGALARSSSSDAPGAYPITQGTFSFGSNYALSVVEGVLTIQPLPTGPLPGITVVGATLPGAGGNGPLDGLYGEPSSAPVTCKIGKQATLICGTF
ncbi:MBG domain-containing protein [Reyranella sp. CPCC 100927]|uniref:MBG domain-containing protein n=1 Tax=Reyranella sp. CPCC 100927 TaxID=2599616 RepID=UPI0015B76303|nr:MBG domain-containing protein [Reyranella sp. CPCC 100927]